MGSWTRSVLDRTSVRRGIRRVDRGAAGGSSQRRPHVILRLTRLVRRRAGTIVDGTRVYNAPFRVDNEHVRRRLVGIESLCRAVAVDEHCFLLVFVLAHPRFLLRPGLDFVAVWI